MHTERVGLAVPVLRSPTADLESGKPLVCQRVLGACPFSLLHHTPYGGSMHGVVVEHS